jgi:DNA-binding MarR family transcriptional regulator
MKDQQAQSRTLTSRDIGETENALRAVLNGVLAGTGLDYNRWVALKVANDRQSSMADAELVRLLMAGLKIDESTADEVIGDLRANGMFATSSNDVDDTVTVTDEGASLYQRLSAQVQGVAAQMYAGLEVDDLAVAYRVLSTLTERANVLLAQAG